MTATPPPPPDRKDADHLRLLVVFHYVVAGLAVLGMGFLGLHFLLMQSIFTSPQMWKTSPGPPVEFLVLFKWLYLFIGCVLVAGAVLNLLSASHLRRRRHRVFSLVVAAINCVQFPFGTALGVFTLLVLLRESVRQSYAD